MFPKHILQPSEGHLPRGEKIKVDQIKKVSSSKFDYLAILRYSKNTEFVLCLKWILQPGHLPRGKKIKVDQIEKLAKVNLIIVQF